MGHLQNRRVKHPLIYVLAATMFIAGLCSGVWLNRTAWTLIPSAILVGAVILEVRHAVFRRRHRVPPLEITRPFPLLRRPIGSLQLLAMRHRIELPTWRGRSFRILLLSDLHIDRRFPADWFASVVGSIGQFRPDLIFVAGDTVNRERELARAPGILKPLASIAPSYAVLGNHDFWLDAVAVTDVLRVAGFTVLRNETREVEVAGARLLLAGVENPWAKTRWHPSATAGLPLFVIAHTADDFQTMHAAGADAVFCGHYHAGQVRLPLVGPLLMPSVRGRRFDHGHFRFGDSHLFISAGLGTEYPPPRLLCPPDIFVVEVSGTRGGDAA
jgi:hypothetical protein